jgi:hypothetical protein
MTRRPLQLRLISGVAQVVIRNQCLSGDARGRKKLLVQDSRAIARKIMVYDRW